MTDLLEMRTALLDATERLVAEYTCFPAGSVIRCFAREVALARRYGAPRHQLAEIVESRTRAALARRSGRVEVRVMSDRP